MTEKGLPVRAVVVDDNPATLYSTSRILRHAGFEVSEYGSGEEALRAVASDVDVVVLDVNLPDVDGIEICRRLRAQPEFALLGIIHLSATNVNDSDRVEGLDAGADAYITHPVHPQVLIATVRTVVRARSAEVALRKSEQQYRQIFDAAPSGLAVLDKDLRFRRTNAEMRRLMKQEDQDLLGRHPHDFATGGSLPSREQFRDNDNWVGVLHVGRGSGPDTDLEWNISPRLAGDDFLAVVTDVTVRERVERERIQTMQRERDARSEAERIARIKDDFLATLSHELRNPLAPIHNAVQILEANEASSDVSRRAREIIGRQTRHLARLVDDLMDVSRITRGLVELKLEVILFSNCLNDAIEASRPMMEAAGHDFTVQGGDDGVLIVADRVRVTQVFTNLLNNAAKYTRPGGRVSVTVVRDASRIVTTIADTGVGIEPAMRDHIFDMFTQANPTGREAAGGLGIGLTLARSLVGMHGGAVGVESAGLDQGSTFTVTLPIHTSSSLPATVTRSARRHDLRRGLAVIIDDNQDAATSLRDLLTTIGYEAVAEFSGASGIATVSRLRPDVVFVDIGMPDINGHDVAMRLRALPETRDVPLLALSGWGQASDQQRSLASGFDQHLVKPITLDQLFGALEGAERLRRDRNS